MLELGLDPLHDTVVVEDVLAGRLSNHCRRLEVFHADGALFLVLLELGLGVFLPWQCLGKQSQLRLVLLLEHSLGCDRIVHSVNDQVRIIDCIVGFGPVLAEDAEAGTAAQASEAQGYQHGQHKNVHRVLLFLNAQESKLLLFVGAEDFIAAFCHGHVEWIQSEGRVLGVEILADGGAFALEDLIVGAHRVPLDVTERLESCQ